MFRYKTFSATTKTSPYYKQYSSYGIIPFLLEKRENTRNNITFEMRDNEIYFLMIQRKNTLGFTEFIRGKYIRKNTEYLQTLIDRMTLNEKRNLQSMEFYDLWHSMWYGKYYTNRFEFNKAQSKFNDIKKNGKLDELINNSTTNYITPEWGFPKGRINDNETKLECAMREMKEETNISSIDYNIIKNMRTQTEIYNNNQDRFFINKYYIAKLNSNVKNIIFNNTLTQSQKKEVNQVGLFKYSECMELIRDYDTQRKKILTNIYNTLIQL
jgi:ADP-ribose pyrophosphatase YjhB (NUDIX family)